MQADVTEFTQDAMADGHLGFLKAGINGGKTGLKGEFPTSAEVHQFPWMLLKFPRQISFPVPVIPESRFLPLKLTF